MSLFRNIVAEEWQKGVKEFGLRPGSPAEAITARIVNRIDEAMPRESHEAVDAVLNLAGRMEDFRAAERLISEAYVRLRRMIPGALDTPHAPTSEMIFKTTEEALQKVLDLNEKFRTEIILNE